MPRFAQYTIANAPESSKPLLARVHKALGFVPSLFAPSAEPPAMLEGYLALSGSLDKGALSATERQLVEIAVSTENHCAYCVAAHSTIAGMLKARPEVVTAVRTGAPVGDRSEEHTSELQSRLHLVCRLLLEKKKKKQCKSLAIVLYSNNHQTLLYGCCLCDDIPCSAP